MSISTQKPTKSCFYVSATLKDVNLTKMGWGGGGGCKQVAKTLDAASYYREMVAERDSAENVGIAFSQAVFECPDYFLVNAQLKQVHGFFQGA